MEDKFLKIKLKTSYFLSAASLSCYYAYIILLFRDRNLSYIEMGIGFAALPLIGVLCQPVWGYVTDKYLNKKTTLIIVMTMSALCILSLTFSRSFNTIILSIILLAIFMTSMTPILDAFCLEISSQYADIQFNRMRLMGSIGYSVCVAVMGIVIQYTNVNMAFYAFFIMNVINIALIISLKYKRTSGESKRINPRYILNLFKDRRFTLFIISVVFVNMSMGSNASYIGEMLSQTGGSTSNLGFMWSVVTFFEVPTFFFGNKILKNFKDLRIFYLSLFFYIIRFFLISLCTSWQWVIAVQVMQAITFALYMVSSLSYLNRSIPPEMLTSGITLFNALGSGLGGFMGNIGGGMILQNFGIHTLYKVMALMCAAALITALLIERRERQVNTTLEVV